MRKDLTFRWDGRPFFVLLGAADPEMEAIESLLKERDIAYGYAAVLEKDGKARRVRPSEAYRGDLVCIMHHGETLKEGYHENTGMLPVLVECSPCGRDISLLKKQGINPDTAFVRVDHHRQGDAGYGVPPAEFEKGSSIGQIARLLGYTLTQQQRVVAAADHCLAAAYKGKCPGVSPEEMLSFRVKSRAAFLGISPEVLQERVEAASAALVAAPSVEFFGKKEKTKLLLHHVDELPEAAVRLGLSYITEVTDRDGRRKVVMGGDALPYQITSFLEAFDSLQDPYGDPARGFAGGYLPEGVTLATLRVKAAFCSFPAGEGTSMGMVEVQNLPYLFAYDTDMERIVPVSEVGESMGVYFARI